METTAVIENAATSLIRIAPPESVRTSDPTLRPHGWVCGS